MKKTILKKILIIFILIISIITLIYSLNKIIKWNIDNNNIKKETNEIRKKVNPKKEETKEARKEIISDFYDRDIKRLKEINPDTIGWIKVNNTNIDYPIVKTDNNEFYLNHSFKKKYNDAGWIFMNYVNDGEFNDKNTSVFGHSRLDRSMFGSLKNALNKSWCKNKDNQNIYVSTENYNYIFKVFSVYTIKTENYYLKHYFTSDEEYQDFLNTLISRSIYNFDNNPTINDNIITLSTCRKNNEKTVMHAKLIKKEEK